MFLIQRQRRLPLISRFSGWKTKKRRFYFCKQHSSLQVLVRNCIFVVKMATGRKKYLLATLIFKKPLPGFRWISWAFRFRFFGILKESVVKVLSGRNAVRWSNGQRLLDNADYFIVFFMHWNCIWSFMSALMHWPENSLHPDHFYLPVWRTRFFLAPAAFMMWHSCCSSGFVAGAAAILTNSHRDEVEGLGSDVVLGGLFGVPCLLCECVSSSCLD